MEWQPIETAPKDGRQILGWRPGWEYPEIRLWAGDEWYSPHGGQYEDPFFWHPVPEPPAPEWKDRTVQYTVTFAAGAADPVTFTHEMTFRMLAIADDDDLGSEARRWWNENFLMTWKEIKK